MIIIAILTCVLLITIVRRKPSFRKQANVLMIVALLMPLAVNALENINININANVEIDTIPRFCINTDECYRFEDGMTWEEWINSDYNEHNIQYFEQLNIIYDQKLVALGCSGGDLENYKVLQDIEGNVIEPSSTITPWENYRSDWISWLHSKPSGEYLFGGPGFSAC
jgi:hypothetical protein